MPDPKIKYEVEWTPWSAVHAAAVKAGWTESGGNADVIDFVDVDDFARYETFSGFGAARRRARSLVDVDTWHCPRIRRYHSTDGPTADEWESDAMWEIFDATEPVFEAYPDAP